MLVSRYEIRRFSRKNHILLSTFVREELHIEGNSYFQVIHEGGRIANVRHQLIT